MSRKLTDQQKEKVREKSRVIGDIILRGGRALIAALRAPSRQENEQAEERFYSALEALVIEVFESEL